MVLLLDSTVIECASLVSVEGNGTPLQYSCLENPMDGGAWWTAVHGVSKSWTRLSDFTFTFHSHHWRRKWQPTPVLLPGESQGRGSLVGPHLWGRTESDSTEATQQQQQQLLCHHFWAHIECSCFQCKARQVPLSLRRHCLISIYFCSLTSASPVPRNLRDKAIHALSLAKSVL